MILQYAPKYGTKVEDTEACSRLKTFTVALGSTCLWRVWSRRILCLNPNPFHFLRRKCGKKDGMRRGKRSLRDERADYKLERGDALYYISRDRYIEAARELGVRRQPAYLKFWLLPMITFADLRQSPNCFPFTLRPPPPLVATQRPLVVFLLPAWHF